MSKEKILEALESIMYKHGIPTQASIDIYHAYLRIKYEHNENT